MIYDKEHYNQVLEVARSYRNDVERLEKQLAEKDKEIETILKENEELVIKHNVYNWGVIKFKKIKFIL